jgi:hypothetical protein
MGLYNRRDMEYDIAAIDRLEQELHAKIARGELPGMVLDEVITEERPEYQDGRPTGKTKLVAYRVRDAFELERRRCRMRLLNSGALIRDLRAAERAFANVPSQTNKEALERAKLRVFRAAGANNRRRKTLGIPIGTDTEPLAPGSGEELSDLEHAYYQDRAAHRWPIRDSNGAWVSGYRAWLQHRLDSGTISLDAYRAERGRLDART